MGDLALAIFFISMLILPCYLATRTVRGKRSAGVLAKFDAWAEIYDDGQPTATPATTSMDRRVLAQQRSREIYLKTGARPPKPDYRPFPPDRRADSGTAQKRKVS